jgi:small subunit ribosomal protein S6
MPLYELFALARPQLSKAQLGGIIKQVSTIVLDSGGVLTDLKSFGERRLAYEIRKPGAKFSEVRPRMPHPAPPLAR